MGKIPCIDCGVSTSCVCPKCIKFYKRSGVSCMDMAISSGCCTNRIKPFPTNISKCYIEINWVDKIKYKKIMGLFENK